MKLLLALILTSAFSASAFAACSQAKDCSTKSDCEALSKEGGPQFRFDANRAQKCMLLDSKEVATNCLQTNNSNTAKSVDSAAGGSTGSSSAAQK